MGQLIGHSDGISSFAKPIDKLTKLASGSFDGEIILWDLALRKPTFKIDSFQNQIKDLAISSNAEFILGAGDNNIVKFYNTK